MSHLFYSGSLPSISVDFKVTGVSTTKCSVYGGCYVTITGSGFPENKAITQINFGRAPCKVNSITNTKLQCQIDIARKVWFVDNSGIHPGESTFVMLFSPCECQEGTYTFCMMSLSSLIMKMVLSKIRYCYHCSNAVKQLNILPTDDCYLP